jgi:hypothetical protein
MTGAVSYSGSPGLPGANRIVQKLQFPNNNLLKKAKFGAFCLDLFNNQPGYQKSPIFARAAPVSVPLFFVLRVCYTDLL